MLYFKDDKDGYYGFEDDAPAEWHAHLTPCPKQVKPQSEIDAEAQALINQEARQYLASTDWLLMRELDGGVVMDTATKQLRAEARARVI